MSTSSSSGAIPDRQILLGLLAIQNHFVAPEALAAGLAKWIQQKDRPLLEVLSEQGALTQSRRDLIEALGAEFIKQNGDSPQEALAALSTLGQMAQPLQKIDDPDVIQSLQLAMTNVGPRDSQTHVFETLADEGAQSTSPPDRGSTGLRFLKIRPHARGGLGQVYVAVDTELNREVALKEIQSQRVADDASRSRFVLEAEITGQLEHPGIVPVYGLGSYADGRPYYAMRFIQGDSLKGAIANFHAARAKDPGLEGDRLVEFRKMIGRFVDVCQAIHYAHSRRVLHRDLKPDNIMLGKYGETMVVDWGLAKPLGAETSEPESGAPGYEKPLVFDPQVTRQDAGATRPIRPKSVSSVEETRLGSIVGTPAYMSPEQASGATKLGPEADIYSLGATLYQVLTGRPPTTASTLSEALDQIRRGDIPAPRTHWSQAPRALEAICQKAMRVDPSARYPSAQALADDIEHWLADEPVTAMPETLVSRAARWVRRHRAWAISAGVGLLAVACVSTGAAFLIQAQKNIVQDLANKNKKLAVDEAHARGVAETKRIEADQKRKEAETANAQAQTVTDYLVATFQSPDPSLDGYRVTVADVLNRSAKEMIDKQDIAPEAQLDVLQAIGNSMMSLGMGREAVPVWKKTVELAEKMENGSEKAVRAQASLGNAYEMTSQVQDAIATLEPALKRATEIWGPESTDTLSIASSYGAALLESGALEKARAHLADVVETRKRVLGVGSPETINSTIGLIRATSLLGDRAQAKAIAQEALQSAQAALGPSHAQARRLLSQLTNLLLTEGKAEEAIAIQEQIYEGEKERLGKDHLDCVTIEMNLAETYSSAGQHERAISLFRECVEILLTKQGENNQLTLTAMNNLSMALAETGQNDEAAALMERIVDLRKKNLGPDHFLTLASLNNLAWFMGAKGKKLESAKLNEEIVDRYQNKFGPNHPDTLNAKNNLAYAYHDLFLLRDAMKVYEITLEGMRTKLGDSDPSTLNTMSNLGTVYSDMGRFDDAIKLCREVYEKRAQLLGPNHPATLGTWSNLAVAMRGSGATQEAEEIFRKLVTLRTVPGNPMSSFGARTQLVDLLASLNRFEEAEEISRSLLEEQRAMNDAAPALDASLALHGRSLFGLRKWSEAAEVLEECLKIRSQRSPDSWTTMNTMTLLAEALYELDRDLPRAESLMTTGWRGLVDAEEKMTALEKRKISEATDRAIRVFEKIGNADLVEQFKGEKRRREANQ